MGICAAQALAHVLWLCANHISMRPEGDTRAVLQIQIVLLCITAAMYGFCCSVCCVWGPTRLRNCQTSIACMENLHGVQSLFMWQLGGDLRRITPLQLLLREFGCEPLVRGWFQSMLCLWNRAVDMPDSCIMKVAFVGNLGLGEWAPASWLQD